MNIDRRSVLCDDYILSAFIAACKWGLPNCISVGHSAFTETLVRLKTIIGS